MARERYLLEDTEDTIHQNSVPPTPAKRRRQTGGFNKGNLNGRHYR